MTRHARLLAVGALLLALTPALDLIAQRPRGGTAAGRVVIITLDGFAGWALDDPHLPVPTLRRLAAQGVVAKGMRPVNPSVTWPNHTTLVTGVTPAKHGVLFNGVLIRKPGLPPSIEPWRDKSEMVRVKTLYDVAHERGLTTAQVDWVAIQHAPTITWEFPERADSKGAIAREMIKAGILSEADADGFAGQNILWRDAIWTAAAAHILRQHRPDLLLFHLLNLDSTQHRYGPRTPAAMTAMAHLDSGVATILKTLDETGLASNTTVFVLSDHGFKAVKRQIRPNVALARAGLLKLEGGKVSEADAYAVPEGGTALVYVTRADDGGGIAQRARQTLEKLEGVAGVIAPSEYAKYGFPQPSANEQMGAFVLTAKDGYAFGGALGDQIVVDTSEGSLGAHGYVASDPDLRALFIASGRGIKRGAILDVIDNVDVAPTAARLLGIEMKDVDGHVLESILSAAPVAGRGRAR
jgi:predicted AlkP superfamily pyrophosphatase or phosphodiesterase